MKKILEYVNTNSDYVKVDKEKIELFTKNLIDCRYTYSMSDIKNFLGEREAILFAFVCESINFCFWGNKNNKDKSYANYIGSERLFNNLKCYAKKEKSFLNINTFINLTEDNFVNIIGNEFVDLPLLHERYLLLKDTVNVIYNKGENFYRELYSIQTDFELLEYIVQNFWHFKDESLYKGQCIRFNKRAILLANDLYQLSDIVKGNVKNLDNLTGCADYALPRLLYECGILKYSEELLKKITSSILIKHNSNMEIEIRANTLYAIELIRENLQKNGVYFNSIEIDNIIWKMRKVKNHLIPVHKTVTIYY